MYYIIYVSKSSDAHVLYARARRVSPEPIFEGVYELWREQKLSS